MICLCSISHQATAQDFEAVERHLGEAIYEGQLTIAQAHIMMQALQGTSGDERTAKNRMEMAGRRIKQAVKSGEMTEEQAKAKWTQIEHKAQLMQTAMKIRAAVARGELTQEEARAKIADMRKHLYRDATGKKIRAAVARGELTEEEGRAKMEAIRKEHERSPRIRSNDDRDDRSKIEDHDRRLGVPGGVLEDDHDHHDDDHDRDDHEDK
jgi:polyhydroxyalkanoate synthesis regulator phasin